MNILTKITDAIKNIYYKLNLCKKPITYVENTEIFTGDYFIGGEPIYTLYKTFTTPSVINTYKNIASINGFVLDYNFILFYADNGTSTNQFAWEANNYFKILNQYVSASQMSYVNCYAINASACNRNGFIFIKYIKGDNLISKYWKY